MDRWIDRQGDGQKRVNRQTDTDRQTDRQAGIHSTLPYIIMKGTFLCRHKAPSL